MAPSKAKKDVPRPVFRAFELLERRWSLHILWALRRDALSFSALRERLSLSPSVLSTRLRELEGAGVVDRDADGWYRPTGTGRELTQLLYELNRWAERSYARPGDRS